LAIAGGKVRVAGRPAAKAGTLVAAEEPILLTAPARPFASRGGEKLEAALDRFHVPVDGRRALDAGASTGGFTDCLLVHGAASVIAVDVGYGQLDWRLRTDRRVHVMERTNVRDLTPDLVPYRPELVVADLSFIALELVLPPLQSVSADDADFLLLVKPQFEAGRADVGRGGVVTDPNVWTEVLTRVWNSLQDRGVAPLGVMASPLPGPAGNVEFLIHARRGDTATKDPAELIEAAVREGVDVQARTSRGGPRP
jgi:23S rRNA (cytidine1920-2'-O)/16S rRNA (cytidine1409-2'-O)-methyltransferase